MTANSATVTGRKFTPITVLDSLGKTKFIGYLILEGVQSLARPRYE